MTTDNDPRVITAQIDIEAPPPAVWNVFRDLEAWPAWNPACSQARWTGGPSWLRGSTAEMLLRVGKSGVLVEGSLEEDDFPWLITFNASAGSLPFERKFELDYTGRRSIQFDTTTFSPDADLARVERLRPGWETMVQTSLESLKAEAERVGVEGIWELTSRRR